MCGMSLCVKAISLPSTAIEVRSSEQQSNAKFVDLKHLMAASSGLVLI